MTRLSTLAASAVFALCLCAPAAARQHAPPVKTQQYVYILKVMPHLYQEAQWSSKDKAATGQHFERLKKAAAEGKVILAGRSTESLDKTFGLVVFEAESDAAARAFMDADPAVVAGVMTATLHPYAVALQRKP